MPLIPRLLSGRKETMKKVKIDIPLELYTDNVRKIIERSLHDLDAEPPYIASFLCDPKFTEKDLETALHLLEKAKTETTKPKFIRAELEARKEIVNPEVFPEDLRKDWEDMRKAAERRRKRGLTKKDSLRNVKRDYL